MSLKIAIWWLVILVSNCFFMPLRQLKLRLGSYYHQPPEVVEMADVIFVLSITASQLFLTRRLPATNSLLLSCILLVTGSLSMLMACMAPYFYTFLILEAVCAVFIAQVWNLCIRSFLEKQDLDAWHFGILRSAVPLGHFFSHKFWNYFTDRNDWKQFYLVLMAVAGIALITGIVDKMLVLHAPNPEPRLPFQCAKISSRDSLLVSTVVILTSLKVVIWLPILCFAPYVKLLHGYSSLDSEEVLLKNFLAGALGSLVFGVFGSSSLILKPFVLLITFSLIISLTFQFSLFGLLVQSFIAQGIETYFLSVFWLRTVESEEVMPLTSQVDGASLFSAFLICNSVEKLFASAFSCMFTMSMVHLWEMASIMLIF